MITANEARDLSMNSNKYAIDKQIREQCINGDYSTIFRYLASEDRECLESLGFTVEKRTILAGTKDIWYVSW